MSPVSAEQPTPRAGYAIECPENCSTRLRARQLERELAACEAIAAEWHRAFQHYYHDAAWVCRQCGLPEENPIHLCAAIDTTEQLRYEENRKVCEWMDRAFKAESALAALSVEVRELREAAKAVLWFDWSGNDPDAVAAIERLRNLSPTNSNDRSDQMKPSPIPYRLRRPHSQFVADGAADYIEQLESELSRLRVEVLELREALLDARSKLALAAENEAGLNELLRNAYEDAAQKADSWSKPDSLKLAAGEMSAQELRTAVAVAKGIASAIRAAMNASPKE